MDMNKPMAQTVDKNHPLLTREAQYILTSWQEFTEKQEKYKRQEMIAVSETFGFVAYMYEKLRSAVEYRGEHVLRRATIERTLKRIIWLPKTPAEIAELLINELTWSRFLANESLPKTQLANLTKIVEKYQYLIEYSHTQDIQPGEKVTWTDWIIGVASTEVEETISPSYLRTILAPLMFSWLKKHFVWDTQTISEEDQEIQLYIAAQRALAKSDQPILRYHLLLLMLPNWNTANQDQWPELVANLAQSAQQVERMLGYSQRNLVFRFVRRFTPVFIILYEILIQSQNTQKVIHSPDALEKVTRQVTEDKYYKLQKQVSTAIVRSIVYLFITKVLLALIIELPYEIYLLKDVNVIPLLINLLTPPGLMLLIGLNVRVPGQDNTDRIVNQLRKLLYKSEEKTSPLIAQLTLTPRQKQLNQYFSVFYFILFALLIYLLVMFLFQVVHYNIVGLLIFFMFMSLVLLFGYRVKWESQELTVAKSGGGIFTHVVSIVTMPFISTGAWLSAGLAQINIFMFFLDVIIDAPLKALVSAVEEWSQFLRRKEAEVVEVPQE